MSDDWKTNALEQRCNELERITARLEDQVTTLAGRVDALVQLDVERRQREADLTEGLRAFDAELRKTGE